MKQIEWTKEMLVNYIEGPQCPGSDGTVFRVTRSKPTGGWLPFEDWGGGDDTTNAPGVLACTSVYDNLSMPSGLDWLAETLAQPEEFLERGRNEDDLPAGPWMAKDGHDHRTIPVTSVEQAIGLLTEREPLAEVVERLGLTDELEHRPALVNYDVFTEAWCDSPCTRGWSGDGHEVHTDEVATKGRTAQQILDGDHRKFDLPDWTSEWFDEVDDPELATTRVCVQVSVTSPDGTEAWAQSDWTYLTKREVQ